MTPIASREIARPAGAGVADPAKYFEPVSRLIEGTPPGIMPRAGASERSP